MNQALAGFKVLDFTWAAAGPLLTKYLADHGALVVKVESTRRLDALRISAPFKDNIPGLERALYFSYLNTNKYSLTLDLMHARKLEVINKLVAWADIVVENFSPGVMEKLGLGYEALQQVKPDIIMVRSSGQGQDGPHARHPSYGWHLVGLAGFTNVTGWADRPPNHTVVPYTDLISPAVGVAAVMAAMDSRDKTGKGNCLDLSQLEVGIAYFLAPEILDCTVHHREASRMGNSSAAAAPHGAYRCRGEDRWCAISISDDTAWQAFGAAIGSPPWSLDPKFATAPERRHHEAELNPLVEAWTMQYAATEVMTTLQAVGVAAGVIRSPEDLLEDPQLAATGYFKVLDHQEMGPFSHPRPAYRLLGTPADLRTASPGLGEHNEYVCRDLLGMTEKDFDELLLAELFQ